MKSIILVDDEDLFRKRLVTAFTRRGFTTFDAANYDEALVCISEHKPHLALIDLKMPGKSGLELIRDVRAIVPTMKIVVFTGYGSIATAIDAVKLGAVAYISKPADVDAILNAFDIIKDPDITVNSDSMTVPSLARAEWEHINRVLTDCGGNISRTAKKLGIHRRSLQRKLMKYPPRV